MTCVGDLRISRSCRGARVGERRPRSILLRVPVQLLLLLWIVACRPAEPPRETRFLTLDAETIQAADGTSIQDFDGEASSIKLGRGWTAPKSRGTGRPWEHYSRATKRASLYFPKPAGPEVEFIAWCSPLLGVEGPPQTLDPILNGERLASQTLLGEWQTIRIGLPAALLRAGVNFLEIGISVQSNDVESESDATADLETAGPESRHAQAIVCDVLAVASRGARLAQLLKRRATYHDDLRKIHLPPATGLAIPLSGQHGLGLQLGQVSSPSRDAVLRLSLRGGNGEARELWRGLAIEASNLALELSDWTLEDSTRKDATRQRPEEGALPTHLIIERPALASGESNAGPIEIALPDDFVTLAASRSAPGNDMPPHVFVYAIDTLRADALGIYGSPRASSPRIDRFASDAVVFEAAWSASSWTLPSTVSLLTGVYPVRHGFAHVAGNPPVGELPETLAQRLGQRGYQSVGVSQTWVASPRFGMDRGFDAFYLSDALGWVSKESQSIRWFLSNYLIHERRPGLPVFGYVHTVDPHDPYSPEGIYRRFATEGEPPVSGSAERDVASDGGLQQRALYDGEVLHADRQFGAFLDLLELLDLYDSSLIILTSDHGEEFQEHGGAHHSRTLFEEVLRVPLVVKFPGRQHAGRRVREQVTTVDVAATILDLTGSGVDAAGLDGHSLADPAAIGDREVPILAETKVEAQGDRFEAVDLSALRMGEIKCIHSALPVDRFNRPIPAERAFNLTLDPQERRPLDPSSPEALRCSRLLHTWSERLSARRPAPIPATDESQQIDEETRMRLEALGYL